MLELHWLPVAERIGYKLRLLFHKALIRHAPQYIADMITPVVDLPARSSLRASHRLDHIVPRTNRKICNRAFAVAAPRAWNQLPTDLKLQQLTTFRRHLKTFLFQRAFCSGDTVLSALEITAVTVTEEVVELIFATWSNITAD